MIHLSNLCTEILEVTSAGETAVCNLGSINLGAHVVNGAFDFEKLAHTTEVAIKYLDRVIDINLYPISTAGSSNSRWRPVGLGVMGLQDAFFKLNLPFDSEEALKLSNKNPRRNLLQCTQDVLCLSRKSGPTPLFCRN